MTISRRTLSFVAIVLSMLYGVGFAVIDNRQTYAIIGGVVVAIAWIAVGMFGSDDRAQPELDR